MAKIPSFNPSNYIREKGNSIRYTVPVDQYNTVDAVNYIIQLLNGKASGEKQQSLKLKILRLESLKTYEINKSTLEVTEVKLKSRMGK